METNEKIINGKPNKEKFRPPHICPNKNTEIIPDNTFNSVIL